ncbi:MAG: hypothetical protein NC181_03455 [Clostridium sp.]|nr:hypothetical protein [Clostridium sp.]MCM1444347.1 hypothetical protein [Candidatus Amulumruptor caecigallinarius]
MMFDVFPLILKKHEDKLKSFKNFNTAQVKSIYYENFGEMELLTGEEVLFQNISEKERSICSKYMQDKNFTNLFLKDNSYNDYYAIFINSKQFSIIPILNGKKTLFINSSGVASFWNYVCSSYLIEENGTPRLYQNTKFIQEIIDFSEPEKFNVHSTCQDASYYDESEENLQLILYDKIHMYIKQPKALKKGYGKPYLYEVYMKVNNDKSSNEVLIYDFEIIKKGSLYDKGSFQTFKDIPVYNVYQKKLNDENLNELTKSRFVKEKEKKKLWPGSIN